MPPHPAQAREREDDRQAKLDALRARLHDAAQALRTPADWSACLRLAARLPGEDFANILLINAQRPGATQVRDYRQWTATGRQVRKGENGIAIFGIPPPPPRGAQHSGEGDDEPGPAWRDADRVTYLWDLSQTTGPPVSDDAAGIQAAGLATRSSRGTFIDRFRDRVMLPVHDAAGVLAGFTGRARPGAGPDVPKYLNSPQTAAYKKSHLLFGLHQARPALARGAVPVIVEGPFDAIAITIADPGRHAGLAPCGTALTSQQAALLSQAAQHLARTGIIVAFDSDTAGRKAAIRAHGILRSLTGKLQSAVLDGKDPAEILQRNGPDALRSVLRDQRQPLSALLIDASIEEWGLRLDDTDGPLMAMRSTASLIASLLPDDTASQICGITAGRELQTTNDLLRPVDNPEIPQIARILPAGTSYQVVRTAGKLGFDCTDVLAEVANATTRSPERRPRTQHYDPDRKPAVRPPSAARLASTSFPRPPLTPHASPEIAARPATPAARQRRVRLAR